jgi:hypothetical protein
MPCSFIGEQRCACPITLQNTRSNKSLLMQIAGENSSPLTKSPMNLDLFYEIVTVLKTL